VSQLLSSRKPRGRFGAPPGPGRPWWQTVPVYILLFASVFAFVLTLVQWAQYFSCADSSRPACSSAQLLTLESGSYAGLVWITGGLLAAYLGCAIAAQLTLSRPHVPFVIPLLLGLLGLTCVVVAWLVLGGYIGTPFGALSSDIPIAERIGS
jgi:hypothetical protein